jgi:hypothetical protein
MRKSAIALAIFATLSTVTAAQADDDFSALLADIHFGDSPSFSETLTPVSQPQQPLQQLTMPELTTPELTMPEISEPRVTLQDPVSAQPAPVADKFDLDSAFALQDTKAGVQATAVGHPFHFGHEDSCDSEPVCTPRTVPNLPNSTFYQYFRSNKCNTNVWDGYRQHCRSANKHINGTCDCFEDKESCFEHCFNDCGEIIDAPVVECSDCNTRPRRQILPLKKSCDDCTKCDAGCDS